MESVAESSMRGIRSGRIPSRLLGLLWVEWLGSWRFLLWFFAVWAVGLWILPLFFHPAFFLALGILYVAVVGQVVAGRDALDGSTEFTLALPVTRGQLYATRAAFAGIPLVVLLGVGLLAVRFGWPQGLWGLVVESGFTIPVFKQASWASYGTALAIPLAHFAWTFALGCVARGAISASLVWIAGFLATMPAAGIGWLLEGAIWNEVNGYISVPILLVVAPAVMFLGRRLYLRREVGDETVLRSTLARVWAWLATAAILFLLVTVIFFMTLTSSRRAAVDDEQRRAVEAAARAQLEAQVKPRLPEHEKTKTGEKEE